jgi:hypothetical protein
LFLSTDTAQSDPINPEIFVAYRRVAFGRSSNLVFAMGLDLQWGSQWLVDWTALSPVDISIGDYILPDS